MEYFLACTQMTHYTNFTQWDIEKKGPHQKIEIGQRVVASSREFKSPDPGLCRCYILVWMIQKWCIFLFWLPKHTLVWFPQCVALLWSSFIPWTAVIRCYSEWIFWRIHGCQCIHVCSRSRAPLKAACTTFIYFVLMVLFSKKIGLLDKP